jgi:hypothetical protein
MLAQLIQIVPFCHLLAQNTPSTTRKFGVISLGWVYFDLLGNEFSAVSPFEGQQSPFPSRKQVGD